MPEPRYKKSPAKLAGNTGQGFEIKRGTLLSVKSINEPGRLVNGDLLITAADKIPTDKNTIQPLLISAGLLTINPFGGGKDNGK